MPSSGQTLILRVIDQDTGTVIRDGNYYQGSGNLEDEGFDVFIGQRALLRERLLAVDVYDDEETVSRLLL